MSDSPTSSSTASFERLLEEWMRTIGLIAGPVLGFITFLINPGGHPPAGRRLLGVLVLAICYWITEAIPLPATALLASALAIICGVAPARAVLAPYADPVIFLFIGSFLLAEAFRKYAVDRRVAAVMLRSGTFGKSPGGLIAGFGVASAAVSTVLSNTATAALMTPIAVGTVSRPHATPVSAERTRPWASGVLLMVAYGASIGGMATLIGTPPNLLVAGFLERLAGVKVTFTAWMAFGVPVSLVLLVISILWTRFALRRHLGFQVPEAPVEPQLSGVDAAEHQSGFRWTIAAFLLAGVLWTFPALASAMLGADAAIARSLAERLPEAGVALLCAALLFIAPINWKRRRFAMTWAEGHQVNWGIILLFGGGLSLGTLAESTGLAKWAGEGIGQMGLSATPAGLLAVSIAITILVSEFASNTAAATLLVPVVIAAAQTAGFDPVRPALGVGLAATCGFIFPVSTPPNAIIFGTGLVPLWRMIRLGILLDLASFVIIWAGLMALTPLLPHP